MGTANDRRFNAPLFTLEEGARHLGIPRSTLRDWTTRRAAGAPLVHRCVPATPRAASLAFIGAVEAHMLRGFRDLGLSLGELTSAVERLRRVTGDEYVLATKKVATDGVHLLADLSTDGDPQWERARDGQLLIREVIDSYLKFVSWRPGDRYAVRLTLKAYEGADVIIDPRFAFGQPVLQEAKVRVEDILDAFWAGEGSVAIAAEFGVRAGEVEAVIRAATRPRAA